MSDFKAKDSGSIGGGGAGRGKSNKCELGLGRPDTSFSHFKQCKLAVKYIDLLCWRGRKTLLNPIHRFRTINMVLFRAHHAYPKPLKVFFRRITA